MQERARRQFQHVVGAVAEHDLLLRLPCSAPPAPASTRSRCRRDSASDRASCASMALRASATRPGRVLVGGELDDAGLVQAHFARQLGDWLARLDRARWRGRRTADSSQASIMSGGGLQRSGVGTEDLEERGVARATVPGRAATCASADDPSHRRRRHIPTCPCAKAWTRSASCPRHARRAAPADRASHRDDWRTDITSEVLSRPDGAAS